MLEKDIEKYLRDGIKKLKGKAYKWVSPGNAGVPDRIVLLPGGRMAFVELKAPGKEPTPLQKVQHKRLSDLGFQVYVIDSKEGVDNFINSFRTVLSCEGCEHHTGADWCYFYAKYKTKRCENYKEEGEEDG